MSRPILFIVGFVLMWSCPISLCAADPPKNRDFVPVSEPIRKAWANVEGVFILHMTARRKDGNRRIAVFPGISSEEDQDLITYFFVSEWQPGMLKNLPAPDALFGLNLHKPTFNDDAIKELACFDLLAELNLDETRVTDAGLKELRHFKKLTELSLYGVPITDLGMKELGKTEVTGEVLLELRK